jgi:Beta-galactosidase
MFNTKTEAIHSSQKIDSRPFCRHAGEWSGTRSRGREIRPIFGSNECSFGARSGSSHSVARGAKGVGIRYSGATPLYHGEQLSRMGETAGRTLICRKTDEELAAKATQQAFCCLYLVPLPISGFAGTCDALSFSLMSIVMMKDMTGTGGRRFRTPVLRCALLCVAGLLVIPGNAFSQMPQGVFSLSGPDQIPSPAVLANDDVDGVSLGESWSDLEPADGVFDWAFLDSTVGAAAAAGKQVLLRISTQSGRPSWVDSAVQTAGGSFFTFDDDGVTTTIPVFWDSTYLAKETAMIAALGAHFTNNPAVKIVTASFANASSEDWNMPHTPDYVAQWLALGYTTQKMLDAGRQVIDATMSAFPNQYVTLAVGGDGPALDPSPDYVARTVVTTARSVWGERLIVQKNDLSTLIPVAPGTATLYQMISDFQPNVAGQMVFKCFNDPSYRVNGGVRISPAAALTESVNNGISYNEKYIEIYEPDVMNLAKAIHRAHKKLSAKQGRHGR